jgi:hypothetical protein
MRDRIVGKRYRRWAAPHAAMTWAGHVCDLRGGRQAALARYRRAMAAYNGIPVRQDQFGIVLDRAWIEKRLGEPYRHPDAPRTPRA